MASDIVFQGRKYCTSVTEAVAQTQSNFDQVLDGFLDAAPGDFLKVRVVDADHHDLYAEPVGRG